MLEAGVVTLSASEWASPMVLVCKKDGGIRWCDDYLCLNSLTAKDAYPVPKIEECLDVLGGACVFSTLICYDLYEHTRMLFGLYSAPSTFQRAMELVAGQEWDRIRADCRRVCLAEQQGDRESTGRVACRYALSIPAQSEALVGVRLPPRLYSPEDWVMVEPHEDGPKVEVARGLATVQGGRVSVRVRNMNPFPVHLYRHQRLARVTSVRPQQVREQGEVNFNRVGPTVVEVALTRAGSGAGEIGGGLPTHLMGESLRGEGLGEEQLGQLQEFLMEWQHLFSTHDEDYGRTDVVRHQIPTGDAAPSRERYRPVPPTLYSEVRTLLRGMLDKGIIRESSSPWAAPIVLVRKKTGSWRFCVDYRRLNQVTKRDAFPLPRVEDSLTSLTQATWYSTLDLASGYWQVQMDEHDREKTAFTTPFGLYEWDQMPFGLCNAPATFQRLMQRCLGNQLMDSTLVYLDDVIVYSPDFKSHLEHLEQVFRSLERYGLKLQPDKCQLFRKEVKFLGHVVSAAGISVDPEKVVAVQEWAAPKTVHQVRSFLGFMGYYRRFIKDFSKIARPINQLLEGMGRVRGRGSPSIQWDPACEAAFQKLKQELLQAPILAYADFTQPFILYTDASHLGLGAVLAQKQQGEEKVIAYASRSLHPTEKNDANYSSFKLELLAVKWALCEKFKDYLWGAKVRVVMDNNPLVHLQTANMGAVEQR
uniref:ribonuclease H n=1 Tax=Cyprinus carpio TaxID=7962 RepID=A0A8C2JKG0_CYPCA